MNFSAGVSNVTPPYSVQQYSVSDISLGTSLLPFIRNLVEC